MDLSGLPALFQEKLSNYLELIEVLKEERTRITSAEVEHLWQISDRKQQIVSRVEDVRNRILGVLAKAGVSHEMSVATFQASRVLKLVPTPERKGLLKCQNSLIAVKKEIQVRARENVAFVEDSLASVTGLIGILTQAGNDGTYYNRHRQPDNMQTRTLLYQKV